MMSVNYKDFLYPLTGVKSLVETDGSVKLRVP